MSDFDRHTEIKAGSERSFGLVFAALFVIVGLWPIIGGWPMINRDLTEPGSPRIWAVGVGAAFLLIALVSPHILRPLNVAWFRFGMLLGAVVSPIVMGVIFFLTVVPTACLARAFGKDPLRLRIDRTTKSYWIERDDQPQVTSSMKNQY